MPTKADLWDDWIERTLLRDIQSTNTPDPVSMVDLSGEVPGKPEGFDSYRYGRGDGEYLYLIYLLEEPANTANNVFPIYIGETNRITSRLLQHYKRLHASLPVEAWEDDGSWGSWSKYDHMAAVFDDTEHDLCVWILDVDTLDTGPYGYSTYRQELEAKLVGLVQSHPRYENLFANREFVPNRVVHEMGKVGPDWLTADSVGYDPESPDDDSVEAIGEKSKSDLWYDWVEQTLLRDIQNPGEADPIPLFDVDDNLQIRYNEKGGLKRSEAIDARIRREGGHCVHESGVLSDTPDGLIYVMYQLESEGDVCTPSEIVPRYIGKAEAYGKKNELSANFDEIARDLSTTTSFARWGDGDYWHVGELSNTVLGKGTKKLAWANELFRQGTRTLKQQTYLWVRSWNPIKHRGPYGYDAYLAEAEPLLIGLALDAYPDHLLNLAGVPQDSPLKKKDHNFEPLSK